MTNTPDMSLQAETVGDRAKEMLTALVGPVFSDTALRVATDWLKQERRLATPSLHPEGEGLTIPAGMKAWHGGDAAPADWDRGPVLFRNRRLSVQSPGWRWKWKEPPYGFDIIAYTPKPSTTGEAVPGDEVRAAWDAIVGDLGAVDMDGDHTGCVHHSDVEHLNALLTASPKQAPATGVGASSGEVERLHRECPYSPNGRHQVDTSMESGPNNCFYCSAPMGDRHVR